MFFLIPVIIFQFNIGNSQLKCVFGPILYHGYFMWMIMFDIKIGKKDNCCVRGQEYQNMPETMKIWKSNVGPNFTI